MKGAVNLKSFSFYVVAILALSLAITRMFFPQLPFDESSRFLFIVASIAFVTPSLLKLLPPLKAVEGFGVKAEFDKAINALEQKVTESEKSAKVKERKPEEKRPSKRKEKVAETFHDEYPPMFEEYVNQYRAILTAQTSNPEKIVAAGILVERMILDAVREFNLPNELLRKSPREALDELTKSGFVTEEERTTFNEFWSLRNLVVHSHQVELTDIQTARVLDLVWRMVRIFA